MNINIDYEKSVRRQRLVYLGTRKKRFSLAIWNYLSGILTLLVCLSLLAFAMYDQAETVLIAVLSLVTLLVIISMFLQNRLVRAKSARSEEDQSAIIRFLLRKYPGIIRHNCSEQIIIITRPSQSVLNKEFLVLQDEEHVYMNISLYNRGRLNMFLAIPHYFVCRAVLRHFRQALLRSAEPMAHGNRTSAGVSLPHRPA